VKSLKQIFSIALLMTKSFKCTDVGTPCDWSATAQNEDELMKKISEHAEHHHGKTDIPVDKVKEAIRDQ
jgi:predicted small metal-binding protein